MKMYYSKTGFFIFSLLFSLLLTSTPSAFGCVTGQTEMIDEQPLSSPTCEGGIPVQWFLPRYKLCTNGAWDGVVYGNSYQKVLGECCNGATREVKIYTLVKGCKLVDKYSIQKCINFSWQQIGWHEIQVGNASDGTPCDDFNPCTENDHCSGGSCAGTPICKASPSSPDDCPCP